MVLVILLALAFGSPDMSFPWWVWVLAVLVETVVQVRGSRRGEP